MVKYYIQLRHKSSFLILALFFLLAESAFGQTTLSTAVAPATNSNGLTGLNLVTFNFQNTNGFPIVITDIEAITGSAGAVVVELWYKTSAVNGAPGAISVANGWTQVATNSITGVANTTTLVTQPFFSGISFTIPAGVTYGFAVACTSPRYYTMVAPAIPTTTISGGGCNIIMGTNISYGGAFAGPANTPRGWIGKITFAPAGPCVNPPVPGTVTALSTTVCPNTNFTLSLSGGSGGTGQTYQWETSTNNSTWTPIAGAINASYVGTQLTSNYYRCQVTCGVTVASPSLLMTTNGTPLAGTYTLDPALPAGGTNYQTFVALATDLSCAGVSAPVIVNVANGTYTEQVEIGNIPGSSAINTVTINGNGATLTFAATTTAGHTLMLSGADNMIYNNLNVVGTGATYALACHLWNQSDNNSFNNCTFTVPANGTATTQVPFSVSGTAVSGTAVGISGNNNILTGCTMNSGYYNTCFVGNTGAAATGNKLINCNLLDFYFYGSYNSNQTNLLISGNTIERPTRTTLSTFYGIYLLGTSSNNLIEKNKIRNPFGANPTFSGTTYGLYCTIDATPGSENKFYNNLISDINSGGTGAIYAMYFLGADYIQAYHNTVSLDNTTSTATGVTYGIYSTGTLGGMAFANNNISITRGGTGTKACLYFTGGTQQCNGNNLYINAAAGTNNVGIYPAGTNFATLALWQGANAGVWDQQSISIDPIPQAPGAPLYNYTPTVPSLDGAGLALGVSSDISGNPRNMTTPDIGCYEFTIVTTDAGVQSLVTPAVGNGCYSPTETISVEIRNFGISAINFATNPATISCNILGPVNSSLTGTPTGILASGATMVVTLTGTADMSVNGTYTIYASINMTGDQNSANNALNPTPTRTKIPLTTGTISALPGTLCVSGSATLNITGNAGANIQWQSSTVSNTGPWINVGTNANSYAAAGINQTTYYQAVLSCNTSSVVSNLDTVTVNNPQLLSTTADTICGVGTLSLEAVASAGTNAKWYTVPSGGTSVYTGSPFVTPVLNTTTTYYVEAVIGAGLKDSTAVPLATGTITGVYHHMFVVSTTPGITLNDIGIKCNNVAGTLTAWDIYYRTDNYQTVPGSNLSATGWTLLSSATGIPSMGATDYTYISLNNVLQIPPGSTYSFYVAPVGTATHQYGTTAAGTVVTTSTNATIIAGHRGSALFNCNTTAGIAIVKLRYSMGCAGTRVPVTAVVNTGPAFSVSADEMVCNSTITPLGVTSNVNDFNQYVWSPTTNLYTNPAATIPYTGGVLTNGVVYHKATTAGTQTLYCNAFNTSSACGGVDSVIINTQPAAITISGDSICLSGSTVLEITGTTTGIQWQEQVASVWTNIAGATNISYTTPTLSANKDYQVTIMNGLGATCFQTITTAVVNNPAIVSTAPASRCGVGPVTLGATHSGAGVVKWYNNLVGGSPIATGNTYTPIINTTTTYYVEETVGATGGTPLVVSEIDLGTNDRIEITNVSGAPLNVNNWKVVCSNNYTVFNSVNANIQTLTGTLAAGATLSWTDLTTGPNYWGSNILFSPGAYPTFTGWVAILDNNNNLIDFLPMNWPAANIQAASITVGAATITVGANWIGDGVNTTTVAATQSVSRQGNQDNNTLADFAIINLSIGALNPGMTIPFVGFGCASSPRQPVTATITAPPALSLSATTTSICLGTPSTTVNLTSPTTNYNTYSWLPSTGVSGSAAAGYTFNPTSTTTYVLAGTQTSGALCQDTAAITVTVKPVPITPTVTPNAVTVCSGAVQTLTASGSNNNVTAATGTGTLTTVANAVTPYSSNYEGAHEQYLVLASELTAMGFIAGSLNSVAFNVTALGTGAFAQSGFKINIAHTANTALTSAYGTPVGAFTTVYGPVSQGLPTLGLNTYTFTTPFNWDGSSNILVDICHDNDPTNTCATCYSSNSTVIYTTTTFNSVWGTYNDNAAACGVSAAISIAAAGYTTRPNMTFSQSIVGNYTWGPTATLYTNTAGTTPYTGAILNPVYAVSTANTTYTVTATGLNGCTASSNATVTINQPAIADAGNGQTICAGAAANLSATSSGGANAGTWSGGAGTFALASSATTTYTPALSESGSTVTLTWTTNTTGVCPAATDTVNITINAPAVANAGANASICVTGVKVLTAVSTPATGSWSTPNGSGAFGNVTSANTIYTPNAADVAASPILLVWTTDDPAGPCGSVADTLSLGVNDLPIANAGNGQSICYGTVANLAASASGGAIGGTWSGGAGSFSSLSNANATYTPDVSESGSTVTLTWTTVGSGSCTAVSDTVNITINTPATASAGIDATICVSGTQSLTAVSTPSTGAWSTTNGAGNFANNTSANTIYTPAAADVAASPILLIWTTSVPSVSCPAKSDTLLLTVDAAAIADAGNGQTLCYGSVVNLGASISGGATSGTWTGGAGSYSSTTAANATYTPDATENGTTFTLTWTSNATGSCAAASDTVNITINSPATANAGTDISVCGANPVTLGASVGGAATSGAWSGTYVGSFSSLTNATGTYTPAASEVGSTVTLIWTSNDPDGTGPCSAATDNVDVTVNGYATTIAPPTTSAASWVADYEGTDAFGWTHYYDDAGTAANYCDDYLMVSVLNANSAGNNIGHIGNPGFEVKIGGQGAYSLTNATTPYVMPGVNWYLMGRYWNLTPVTQPVNDVNVKFYFTNTDFNAVNAVSPYVSTTPTQMAFYKINNGVGGTPSFNPDPALLHAGVPMASPFTYDGTGYWQYINGATASTTTWAYSSMGADHVAEYTIDRFSGGGGGGGSNNPGAFPVELLSFSGYNNGDENILQWTTAKEINNKNFILMHSVDNIAFEEIANVPTQAPNGISNTSLNYSVKDLDFAAKTYYRLRQIDIDGTSRMYPATVEVNINNELNTVVALYPNPAKDVLNVSITQPQGGKHKIEVYDAIGKLVSVHKADLIGGNNVMTLDVATLAKGTYIIMVKNADNGTVANTRFVKE